MPTAGNVKYIQNNLTAGEISPKMIGRTDFGKYSNAVGTLRNYIVFPQGGATRRPGFRFVAEVKNSSKRVRLIAFLFNILQAYILEVGELYIRFFANNGQLVSGLTPVEISTGYIESQLSEIKTTQSADVMLFAHRAQHPARMQRFAFASFGLDNVPFTNKPANFANSSNQYPGAVTFFEQRLCWGGSDAYPTTLFLSKTADIFNMELKTSSGEVLEDNAVEYPMAASNLIRWLDEQTALIVGTAGEELSATGGTDEPITPDNIKVQVRTNYGSSAISPTRVQDAIIFVDRTGTQIREFASPDGFRYAANDLTILADHIPAAGIVDMAYQHRPHSIVWIVLADGTLASMTYLREQNVFAWATHPTQGKIESVAVIPHPAGNRDQLWLAVKRTINGQPKRYIEYMDDGAEHMADRPWKELETDSALTYKGPAIQAVSGLGHLEGMTVQVIADGGVHPDRTVTNGQITLQKPASEIEIGLRYDSKIVTLEPEPSAGATTLGAVKRWNKIEIEVLNTIGIRINGESIPFRRINDVMDRPPPLFSGRVRVRNPGADPHGRITIEQTQPLPQTIVAIHGEMRVAEA